MKKLKKCTSIVLIITMLLSFCTALFNTAYADTTVTKPGCSVVLYTDATRFDFNPKDTLVWAAYVGTHAVEGANSDHWPFKPTAITEEGLNSKKFVPLDYYKSTSNEWLNAEDASDILRSVFRGVDSFGVKKSMASHLGVSEDDVDVTVISYFPYDQKGVTFEHVGQYSKSLSEQRRVIKEILDYCKKCATNGSFESRFDGHSNYEDMTTSVADFDTRLQDEITRVTNDEDEEIPAEYTTEQEQNDYIEREAWINMISKYPYYTFRLDASVTGYGVYSLVLAGQGDYANKWFMERVSDVPDINPDDPNNDIPDDATKFSTEMEYISIIENEVVAGKMATDGVTYLPPYYENDIDKKDADVTVKIKSKTTETIVATNSVALTSDNVKTNPNSEGWYYPDVNDKKVIAKDYPFDKYDNTTYNGYIQETVSLTGGKGNTSSQTPTIKWTFRRKNIDRKEYTDGSTTVVITYNLPIDTTKIPEGWTAIYDEDGKTSHKISRTFPAGENYDKDVPVKQNGFDETVITHVTVKSPTVIAKAGQSMAIAGVILAVVVVALNRYFKFNKMKRIK